MIIFLKSVLIIIIIFGCSYLGYLKSISFIKREKILKDFDIFFNRIKNEICYMQTTVPNLIENNRQDLDIEIKNALGAISTDMLITNSLFQIEKSIEKNIDKIKNLNSMDKNYIIKGLNGLGKTDEKGQESLICNTVKFIDMQIEEASNLKNKNAKLYKNLGFLFGMFVVIVFI